MMKALDILACCLFVAAIAAEICAKSYDSSSAQIMARAAADDHRDRSLAEEGADAWLKIGDHYAITGLILVGLGLVSWLVSPLKGRRLTPVIPWTLFITYILLWFLLV